MPLTPFRSRGLLAVLAVGAALLIAMATAAAAHEGQAIINVESQADQATGTEYTIRAVWTNDGHPAADATVTATPIDPAGTNGTPVALMARDDDGRYGGFVPMPLPGRWTVRFTIVAPTGTLQVTRDVTEATTTTAERSPSTTRRTPGESNSEKAGGLTALFVVVGLMAALSIVAWLMHRQSKKAKSS